MHLAGVRRQWAHAPAHLPSYRVGAREDKMCCFGQLCTVRDNPVACTDLILRRQRPRCVGEGRLEKSCQPTESRCPDGGLDIAKVRFFCGKSSCSFLSAMERSLSLFFRGQPTTCQPSLQNPEEPPFDSHVDISERREKYSFPPPAKPGILGLGATLETEGTTNGSSCVVERNQLTRYVAQGGIPEGGPGYLSTISR
jgi:hypothetical protein